MARSYIVPSVAEIKEKLKTDGSRFEVVSLFAGGGGSSTGYRMAQGKVLAINEFIPEAVKTYSANWPDTLILPGDVRALTGKDLLSAIGKEQGQLDILDGSPPCSAFSTAGARQKGWGKVKKYSDASQKNVEDLFFEYIRILTEVRPKVFVAENVSGLAKGAAKGYLNEIIRQLRGAGYHVECKILDAQWLGVPQTRARTIFVGVRNDLYQQEMKGNLHPKPLATQLTLAQAFDGLKFSEKDRADTDVSKYAVGQELRRLSRGKQSKKYFQLVKAHPDKPSGCITATYKIRGAAKIMHWDNRCFSIAELKRIMSVPDDYVLTGLYPQQAERLGRMVAPFMMKAIAEQILSLGVLSENSK